MNTYTILVADDEQSNLQTILNYLENSGHNYNILNAINGEIACKVAEKKLPDIIIMDWEMPIMNGIEAVRYLKKQPETMEIPIIMATGIMVSSENLETALKAGAIDYIRKPIDRIELLARLQSALALSISYKKNKEQREEILAQRNRQLTTTTMQIIQKNEILSEIQTRLEKLVPIVESAKVIPNVLASIKEIVKSILKNADLDSDWDSFYMHFERVHHDFFDKLQKEFPSLSQNELRFCAYIRMNLPTKVIARLLNINAESVKMTRYRLKKKMQLAEDVNLGDFIINF